MNIFEYKEEELPMVVSNILREIETHALESCATVIFLEGELGAGKTTFTKTLAAQLGAREHVVSPTFVLMKQYELKSSMWDMLIHIDAYRFDTPEEAHILNLDYIFSQPKTIVCIEWPSKLKTDIPTAILTFSHVADGVRRVVLSFSA